MKKNYLLTYILAFCLLLTACGLGGDTNKPEDNGPDVIEDGVNPKEPTDDPAIEDGQEHSDEDTNPIEEVDPEEGKENSDVETTDKLIGVYLAKVDENISTGQAYVKYDDGKIWPAKMEKTDELSYIESELEGISDLGAFSGFNQDAGIPERSLIAFGKATYFDDINISKTTIDADLDLEDFNEPIDLFEVYLKANGDVYIKQAYQLGTDIDEYSLELRNEKEVEANTDEIANYMTIKLDIER